MTDQEDNNEEENPPEILFAGQFFSPDFYTLAFVNHMPGFTDPNFKIKDFPSLNPSILAKSWPQKWFKNKKLGTAWRNHMMSNAEHAIASHNPAYTIIPNLFLMMN